MSIFTGSAVALITPFHDGTIDYTALTRLIELQIAAGSDAIVALGTTGEAATMMEDEREEVIRFVVERVSNRIPVIVGTGRNNTEDAIQKSRFAEAVGADGLLIVTPFYNKTTQEGLLAHYSSIAEQVRLPIIVYNVPSRTGLNIKPETVAKLVRSCENIVGIKEANGNISKIAETMDIVGDRLDLYSGNDDQVVPLLSLGGIGVISVLSNVVPKETHDMVEKFLSGDTKGALDLQLRYTKLIKYLFSEVNPVPVKAACAAMGFCQNVLRSPLYPMEEAHEQVLLNEMRKLGIL